MSVHNDGTKISSSSNIFLHLSFRCKAIIYDVTVALLGTAGHLREVLSERKQASADYTNIRPENWVIKEILADPTLMKSLGVAIPRHKRSDKTLKDARLNQDNILRFHEVLKASQESFESSITRDERRLRRVVADHNYDVMREGGVQDHRRKTPRFQSAFGKRRARTQALRRQKLNSQGLRSHLHHSRQTTSDYSE